MRRVPLAPILLALVGATFLGWAELVGYAWTDYELANEKPFRALVHGQLGAFFDSAPIDGPSLLLRAPFALLSWIWGAGDMAIYRLVAVPGLLAGAILGVVLWAERARLYPLARYRNVFLLLAAANPVMLIALRIGHPEELFGAVLCVAAVLAALGNRPTLAGLLLGVAIGNKAWAVLAVGPVLLALGEGRRRALAIAVVVAGCIVAPFMLSGSREEVTSASSTGGVFQPWQVFWFFGSQVDQVAGFFGVVHEDFRTPPAWAGRLSHPLVVALGFLVPVVWWLRHRGRRATSHDALLMLALLLLARCVFDTANNAYYHLPFLMALLMWEARTRSAPPVYTLAASAWIWLSMDELRADLAPDLQSLIYLAWALPALVVMTRALVSRGERRAAQPTAARFQPIRSV
ncbi:MAG TPA: glycosyltransferase family 87 protein [Solirubrobacteraceae bacterium]